MIINNNFNLMVEKTDKPDLAPGKYDDDGSIPSLTFLVKILK